jgi:tetratricopeptide (TPR) repeat protein
MKPDSCPPPSDVAASPQNEITKPRVFLCYAREDSNFAAGLRDGLVAKGIDVYQDVRDIELGEAWRERVRKLIDHSDAVLVVLSGHFKGSPACQHEIDQAEHCRKQLIPILVDSTEYDDFDDYITSHNGTTCFSPAAQQPLVDRLVDRLNTNLSWIRHHTDLHERSLAWKEKRPEGRLLRGVELQSAESWLDRQPRKAPAPTSGQVEFIRQSRKAQSKKMRRLLALASGIIILLLAAFILAEGMRQRAEANYALAKNAAGSVLIDLAIGLRNTDGVKMGTVQKILETVRSTHEKFAKQAERDAEVWAHRNLMHIEFAKTYLKVGEILAAGTNALHAVRAAEEMQALGVEPARFYAARGAARIVRGDCQRAGRDSEAARSSYDSAEKDFLAAIKAGGEKVEWRRSVGAARGRRAEMDSKLGRKEDSLSGYLGLVENFRQLAGRPDAESIDTRGLASTYINLAHVQDSLGRWADARQSYVEGLKLHERLLGEAESDQKIPRRGLVMGYSGLGDIEEKVGSLEHSLQAYSNAWRHAEAQLELDRKSEDWKSDLSQILGKFGTAHLLRGRYEAARDMFDRCLEIRRGSVKIDKTNKEAAASLVWALNMLAESHTSSGDTRNARSSLEEGQNILSSLAESAAPPIPAMLYHNLDWSALCLEESRLADAECHACIAADMAAELVRADPHHADLAHDQAVALLRLAEIVALRQQPLEASRFLDDARSALARLGTFDSLCTPWKITLSQVEIRAVQLAMRAGTTLQAEERLRPVLAFLRELVVLDPERVRARVLLMEAHWTLACASGDGVQKADHVRQAMSLGHDLSMMGVLPTKTLRWIQARAADWLVGHASVLPESHPFAW